MYPNMARAQDWVLKGPHPAVVTYTRRKEGDESFNAQLRAVDEDPNLTSI